MKHIAIAVLALMLSSVVLLERNTRAQTSFLQPTPTTLTWTSATAVGTVGRVSTAGLSSVIVTLNGSTTATGGQVEFLVSDDAATVSSPTWFPIRAYPIGSGDWNIMTQISPLTQAWQVDVDGWRSFGVRLRSPITGAGNTTIRLSPTASPGGGLVQPRELTGQLAEREFPRARLAPTVSIAGTLGQKVGTHGTGLDAYIINSYDPCQTPTKGNIAISQILGTRLLLAQQNKRAFICSLFVVAPDAELISLVEGTGVVCASAVGLVGGGTAATGMSLGAQGGFMLGNGQGTIAMQNFQGADICLLQSGTGRVAGNMTYVWEK